MIKKTPETESFTRGQKPKWLTLDWWTSLSGVMTAIGTLVAILALITTLVTLLHTNVNNPPQNTNKNNPQQTGLQQTPWLGLEFWQDGMQDNMTVDSSNSITNPAVVYVTAKSAPFEIRFPKLSDNIHSGMHLCAWIDNSIFIIKANTSSTNYPFFSPAQVWPVPILVKVCLLPIRMPIIISLARELSRSQILKTRFIFLGLG